MPNYSFQTQIVAVVATIGIHNFIRQVVIIDEAFTKVHKNPNANDDKIEAEMSASEMTHSEQDGLRDYMAQQQ